MRRTRGLKIGLTLLLGLIAWLGLVIPTSAQAILVSSNPVDGSTVQGPVTAILLNFGEGVQRFSKMTVEDQKGQKYKVKSFNYNGKQVMVNLQTPLNEGQMTLTWNALGEGGAAASGSLHFTVENSANQTKPSKITGTLGTTQVQGNQMPKVNGVTLLLGILFLIILIGLVIAIIRGVRKGNSN